MHTVTAYLERIKEAQQRTTRFNRAQGAWMQILLLRRNFGPAFDPSACEPGPQDDGRPSTTPTYDAIPLRELVHRRATAMMPLPPVQPAQQLVHFTPFNVVRGEILRDRYGRLYERTGAELRPLYETPATSNDSHREEAVLEPAIDQDRRSMHDASKTTDVEQHARQHQPEQDFRSSFPTHKKMFADPGRRCLARFGDIKHILGSQIAQPSRLRDEHQLPCYVQVYEIAAPYRIESLTSALLSETGYAGKLFPLTDLLVRTLQLHDVVQQRPPSRETAHREAGLLLPGDRLVRLQVIQDPTKEREPAETAPSIADPQDGSAHCPDRAAPQHHSAPMRMRKTQIPPRYVKSWEFHLSREEALYDMRTIVSPSLGGLLVGLKKWVTGRAEFKKWQALLAGKSVDEQLWTVKPPKGSLRSPAVRNWAYATLDLGGYDPRAMLTEWELYWRRKGL